MSADRLGCGYPGYAGRMISLHSVFSGPFRAASALRGARVFHPRGVLFRGVAELDSRWWPVPAPARVPVTARLSGAVGTPDGVPDILGLALRFSLEDGPWDILLATLHVPTRAVLLPARGWSTARYGSLMAYRTNVDLAPRWIFAFPEGDQPSSTSVLELARHGVPLLFSLHVASARGPLVPAGRVTLESAVPASDEAQPSFDPVLNHPAAVELWPRWLVPFRRDAYRGSRSGRGASDASARSGFLDTAGT
ncbi:Catalase domain protein [Rhodococcus rhodochrous ATCC 21198]|nr:Catalase domain protein [Rhodococcus rhodochrous ATCC 21198]NCL74313.1 hypothetical protein [Rhodococcus sp. YH1]